MNKVLKKIFIVLLLLTFIGITGATLFMLIQRENKNYDVRDKLLGLMEEETGEADKEVIEDIIENPEQINQESEVEIDQEDVVADTTLVFAGDVLLSSYVLQNYTQSGINGVMSSQLQNVMNEADITMVNQEFPFSNRGTKAPDKQYTFRVDPTYADMFTEMGIDIVTLANNHSLDYGKDSLQDTMDTLTKKGIEYVGAGSTEKEARKIVTIEKNGYKIGFLGASRVIPVPEWNIENDQPGLFCTYDPEKLNEEIRFARKNCDYVIVYVHWGVEKSDQPEEYQQKLAYQYVDNGADLVIGAHPHVLQGIEYYKDVPIVYSLGNFIFNQEIKETVLLKVTVDGTESIKLKLLPAFATGAYTQELIEEEKIINLFAYLEDISQGVLINDDGSVVNLNR